VADDIVAQHVTGLEFLANNFNRAVAVFHLDGFVQFGVKNFTNCFDAFNPKLGKALFELL
jgi:hypothetical protein